MIGTNRSVRVRRRAATKIALSVERNDGGRYSKFAEHSLNSGIRHNRAKRCSENGALVLVLAQGTLLLAERGDAAQRRRNIELHHGQDAAILRAHHGL